MGPALILPFFFCPAGLSAASWALVKVPVADVRAESGSVPASQDYDPKEETQVLYNEPLDIFARSGDWLRIEAPEQPEFSHNNRWQGYPGWVRRTDAREVRKPAPASFVVKAKLTHLYASPGETQPLLPLSMGTKLNGTAEGQGEFWKIKSVEGRAAWVPKKDVRLITPPLPEEFSRKLILDSAAQLIGDLYFWGGRSAHLPELAGQVTAVDCSGLVQLAYRVAGIAVPRDSYEQYLKARKIARGELRPGDLIFSGPADKPGKITHVALFLDGKTLIEAPQTGEAVRRIEIEKKYGAPLEKLEPGQVAGKRILYFGTFFENPQR